jgi:hypothetical protein
MQRRVGMADGEARGRTLGAVIKEKDEELALFLEMRRREKERGAAAAAAAVAAADQLLLSGDSVAGDGMLLLGPPPPAGENFISSSSSGLLRPFLCILLLSSGNPSLSWFGFLVIFGCRAQTGGVQSGWWRI